jgi:hypothetical protein
MFKSGKKFQEQYDVLVPIDKPTSEQERKKQQQLYVIQNNSKEKG